MWSVSMRDREQLRNVIPRKGTETFPVFSRTGTAWELRNVIPRKGTETVVAAMGEIVNMIEKCNSP